MWTAWIAIIVAVGAALLVALDDDSSSHPEEPDV